MVDLVKQDMTYLWSQSGDIVPPDNVKIEAGWAVETVPRQWWNWMQNRVDTNVAYALQKGIPEWDTTTEYIANKSYVQYLGVIYKAIATSTNAVPSTSPASWVKAFAESSASLEALKALTPAADRLPYFTNGTTAAVTPLTAFARTLLDDTDATAARTTLGAQASDATLTAIAGAATGTNILHYFTGTDAVGTTTLTAFGRSLIDDADATAARTTLGLGSMALQNSNTVAITGGSITGITDLAVADGGTGSSTAAGARTNLGLGTTATADVQTSAADATSGRVLVMAGSNVGPFGLSTPLNFTDANDVTWAGFARNSGLGAANNPTAGVSGIVSLPYTYGMPTQGAQLAVNYTTDGGNYTTIPRLFARTKSSASDFGAWAEFYSTSNIGTASIDSSQLTGIIPDARLSGTYTGVNITGNANTATTLQTARTINGVSFDGSANITVADATKLPLTGGKMTGTVNYEADDQVSSWARGVRYDDGGVIQGQIGGFGPAGDFTNLHMALGASPWASGTGIRVASTGTTIEGSATVTNGNILISATAPQLNFTETDTGTNWFTLVDANSYRIRTGTLGSSDVFSITQSGFISGNGGGLTALNASNITTGTLAVARGGTGATAVTGSGNNVLSASPALTGVPTAPTAANGTNTTQIATCAFVQNSIGAGQSTAWVSFVGTGTVTIRGSFNVSSITDLGAGRYRVNYASALSTANYSAVATAALNSTGNVDTSTGAETRTFLTTSLEVLTFSTGAGSQRDSALVNVAVFGG